MYRDVRLEQFDKLTAEQRKAIARRRRRAIDGGVAVAEEPPARVEDWRDAAERRADAKLVGNWWRCREHGPTQEAIYVGDGLYCPDGDCTLPVLQVHAAINDPESVERATSLSAWKGSKGHAAQRERAGLEPDMPVIQRRLLERPASRAVPIDDDEDLVEGSDVAPDVDEVLDQEEEPESEGNDGVAAPPPATEQEQPMPDADKVPASVVILEMLQKRAPITRKEFVAEFASRRPELGERRACKNVDAALSRLRATRAVERDADGEYGPGLGVAVPAPRAQRKGMKAGSAAPPLVTMGQPSPERAHHVDGLMTLNEARAASKLPEVSFEVEMQGATTVRLVLTPRQQSRVEALVAVGPRGMTFVQAMQLFLEAAFAENAA